MRRWRAHFWGIFKQNCLGVAFVYWSFSRMTFGEEGGYVCEMIPEYLLRISIDFFFQTGNRVFRFHLLKAKLPLAEWERSLMSRKVINVIPSSTITLRQFIRFLPVSLLSSMALGNERRWNHFCNAYQTRKNNSELENHCCIKWREMSNDERKQAGAFDNNHV